jgi:hypothetical protein
MLFLGGRDFPTNRTEFVAALNEALTRLFRLPPDRQPVELAGDRYPALDKLIINLTDAQIQDCLLPARLTRVRQPGVTIAQFQIVGRPVYQDQAALHVDTTLTDASFEFRRDADGRNFLHLLDGRSGQLFTQGSQADFQTVLLRQLQTVAAAYGATLESAEWTLTDHGNRSFGVELRVKASREVALLRLGMTLNGRGQVTIDDHLNARLSGLSVEGEGMLSNLLLGFVQDYLERLEGAVFPLTALSCGRLRLRDLKIRCDHDLEIEAKFGS